jgi:hypothetical protein
MGQALAAARSGPLVHAEVACRVRGQLVRLLTSTKSFRTRPKKYSPNGIFNNN